MGEGTRWCKNGTPHVRLVKISAHCRNLRCTLGESQGQHDSASTKVGTVTCRVHSRWDYICLQVGYVPRSAFVYRKGILRLRLGVTEGTRQHPRRVNRSTASGRSVTATPRGWRNMKTELKRNQVKRRMCRWGLQIVIDLPQLLWSLGTCRPCVRGSNVVTAE
jgi:hypothetical protein